MKNFQPIILLCSLMVLYSCQPHVEKQGDFNLLPLPQEFEITGAGSLDYDDILYYHAAEGTDLPVRGELLQSIQSVANESRAQLSCRINPSIDVLAEGYTLNISRKKITVTGKDRAGLLYAFMTLEQLLEDAKEQDVPLPVCEIKDFPLLSFRAIHLDMKHHMEKTGYYYDMIDRLAKYKINAIIAEMEDKLKYERQPVVGSADALTIEEWKAFSEYAMERNIEISPLIQGLGHASFILKHEEYTHLRDDPESDWAFNPLVPETYEVQFDLYRDAMEATPYGKYLHVGGDEVHTTGRGSGKSPLELQLIWLNKVCRFAEENGRTPIFWDDMLLKHAGVYETVHNEELTDEEVEKIWDENEHILNEFLDQFPRNCIYMRWNYWAPQLKGNLRALEWFVENGLPVMGATAGQTRWVLMPQNESNMENIRFFAVNSIENELDGLLLTLWDDDSPHFELYWRGILAFAEYTWAGDKRSTDEIKSAYRHRAFSVKGTGGKYAFIDQLEEPVAFWKNALLKENSRNHLVKLGKNATEAIIDFPDKDNKGEWSEKYAGRLEQAKAASDNCGEIAEKIRIMKSVASRNMYTLDIYEQVNELVRFTSHALLALNKYDTAENDREEQDALEQIRQLPEEFRSLRQNLEQVYGKTRLLEKPEDYILDQDHHFHLANQTVSFDWLFMAEILFMEKIKEHF